MNEKQIKIIKHQIFSITAVIVVISFATLSGMLFRNLGFPETNIVLVYLLSVVIAVMVVNGYTYAILVSIVATFAYNYFFTVPYHSFAVNDPNYFITFFIMTVTGILTSTLTIKVKKNGMKAHDKERETKALYELTSGLSEEEDIYKILETTVRTISQALKCQAGFICFQNEETTKVEPRAVFWDIPANGVKYNYGVVRIPIENAQRFSEEQKQFLHSIMECSILAMDKSYSVSQHMKSQQEMIQERYRSSLLRAISHDLRTPLAGIMGMSEMLMDMSDKDDPRYQIAQGIHTDTDWLHSLVENILSLTRLQEGNLTIKKQMEAAEEVVGSVVAKMEGRAPQHEIHVDVPKDIFMIPMDAKLIMQILINLLDNAIKHTPPEKEISICVREDKEKQEAVFIVADRGEGIKAADLPHVFEMFYTTSGKSADAKKGIGLGLAICESIINAHGGVIYAENQPKGRGARFVFTLPLDLEEERN